MSEFFLFKAESYFTVHIHHILLNHSSVHGHLGCFHLLATVNNTPINLGVQTSVETLLSVLVDIYPEVELMDHIVTLRLIFCGTTILFSTVAVLFYIPTNSAQRFQFLRILPNTCYFLGFLF